MKFCGIGRLVSLLIVIVAAGLSVNAQDLTPWTANPYGNQWIDYTKKYVRVGVPSNGIYKVSYPSLATALQSSGVTITPERIQLWHRGKQVAILSSNSTEVVFYGEKNDGASDGLMFRPGPEARLNTYSSFFSEEGSYFFTVADSPSRSLNVSGTPVSAVTPEAYHFETFLKKFDDYETSGANSGRRINTQKFAFATGAIDGTLNQSYYTEANAWTGPIIYGPEVRDSGTPRAPQNYTNVISLKNFASSAAVKPVLTMSVHGQYIGEHRIKGYASNSAGDVDSKEIVSTIFTGYGGAKLQSDLTLNTNVASDGTINFMVKSISSSSSDYFGVSFIAVVYPQNINVSDVTSAVLTFKATGNSKSIIPIAGTTAGTTVYDISNPYQPIKLTNGTFNAGTSTLSVEVSRTTGQELKLLVVNSTYSITTLSSFKDVNFQPLFENAKSGVAGRLGSGALNPAAFDYLIVTNDNTDPSGDQLRDLRDGAKAYAQDFRSQELGGSYNTLVMDIRNIYDQFNYGEPSAIAIKRFIDYMLQSGIRPKHNLLLLGISITYPVFMIKEMPGEVPSFGDPGSDILLVCGLTNSPNPDVPAIPVGRVVAFRRAELSNYMAKVREYQRQNIEGNEESLAWRKKVVHLIGAKHPSELNEFKDVFSGVSTYVHELEPTRTITTLSNDAWATSETTDAPTKTAPMAAEVNPGVGMIAYYGHGAQNYTLYNIGRVSDSLNYSYTANNKFPVIYFNGCGVGNEFTSRNTHSVSADWIVTPNKGAVTIICNAYKSYVSPTKIYIDQLYQQIFRKTDANRKTAGQIVVDMGRITINGSTGARMMADQFQITNIHQTNLYGDPAVLILNSKPSASLPVNLVKFNAKAQKNGEVLLTWTTTSETNNSHFDIERSFNSKDFEVIGKVDGKGSFEGLTTYNFIDQQPFEGLNYYRLRQVDVAGTSEKGETLSQIVSVKVEGNNSLVILPNPVVSNMEIRTDVTNSLQSWKIYNQKGQTVKLGKDQKASLDSLISGIYIVEITTKKGEVVRRSVVKR